jgi:hypothetical protein
MEALDAPLPCNRVHQPALKLVLHASKANDGALNDEIG